MQWLFCVMNIHWMFDDVWDVYCLHVNISIYVYTHLIQQHVFLHFPSASGELVFGITDSFAKPLQGSPFSKKFLDVLNFLNFVRLIHPSTRQELSKPSAQARSADGTWCHNGLRNMGLPVHFHGPSSCSLHLLQELQAKDGKPAQLGHEWHGYSWPFFLVDKDDTEIHLGFTSIQGSIQTSSGACGGHVKTCQKQPWAVPAVPVYFFGEGVWGGRGANSDTFLNVWPFWFYKRVNDQHDQMFLCCWKIRDV